MLQGVPLAPAFPSVLLEGVFDLLADLLHACLGLIGLTFGFQAFVTGGFADGFLALAADFLGSVLDLVTQTHDDSPINGRSAGSSRQDNFIVNPTIVTGPWWSISVLFDGLECDAAAGDLFQNALGGRGPDPGFWFVVVDGEVVLDGRNEIGDGVEGPAPQGLSVSSAGEAVGIGACFG